MNRLEAEARELFGPMREATDEEQASIEEYIRSISQDIRSAKKGRE